MRSLTFTVTGRPAPQGSKRGFVNHHTGKVAMVESAGDRVRTWREDVRATALTAAQHKAWKPVDGPIAISIQFYLPRPKGHYGTGRNSGILKPSAPTYPAVMPDIDKLARSTLDALKSAHVIVDDSRAVQLAAWKLYADGRAPGAQISITHMEEA